MAKVFVKDNLVYVQLSEDEAKKSNLNATKEYDFIKAKEGLFLLSEKLQILAPEKDYSAVDQKIFSKLSDKKQLSNNVEGRFEKQLNKEELARFNELLKSGKIVKFKLSDKYKKAIYKISEKFTEKKLEQKAQAEQKPQMEQNIGQKPAIHQVKSNNLQISPDYFPTLSKDGYTIVDESVAKQISEDCADRIKDKELFGMKLFDGKYCVIESYLFEKHQTKILQFIQKNKCSDLATITSSLNLPESLVKVICGLLCEKGDLLEKRRNLYCFIS